MTEKLTLEELKAQNAVEDKETEIKPVEIEKEDNQDKKIEVDESNTEVDTDVKADKDEADTDVEIEPWMQSEEATHKDDQKSNFVPNHEAAERRRKAKALKGELNEQKDENAELKARIAALEAGNTTKQETVNQPLPRPTREQFDYDDDAYDVAVDEWNDKKFDTKLSNHYQTSRQKAAEETRQAKQKESAKKSLDDHYERAAALVESGSVSEENYKNADKMVRLSLDQLNPGKGDALADAVISTLNSLGAGSEKVMYQLGVNSAAMNELKSKLIDDPSGNLVSAYLGQLQTKIQNPSKRRSQAPKPGKDVAGESGSGGPAGVMQSKYSKSTDPQERINLKQAAKKQGIDTKKW